MTTTTRDLVLRDAEEMLAKLKEFQAKTIESNRAMEASTAKQIADIEALIAEVKAKGPS